MEMKVIQKGSTLKKIALKKRASKKRASNNVIDKCNRQGIANWLDTHSPSTLSTMPPSTSMTPTTSKRMAPSTSTTTTPSTPIPRKFEWIHVTSTPAEPNRLLKWAHGKAAPDKSKIFSKWVHSTSTMAAPIRWSLQEEILKPFEIALEHSYPRDTLT
ncbi:hypothetical protein Tco_0945841 [Tanacetum coccineum]